MISRRNTILAILLLLGNFFALQFFTPGTIYAAGEATRDTISVDISPEFPGFGDPVTITLSSYGTDLERANIIWKEGNTTRISGVGETLYTTVAPSSSGTKTITIIINQVSGATITKNIAITPATVDLLVESIDSYTPPFYKGRSLPTRESLVKVSAVPQISNLSDSKNAVYTWRQNSKARPEFSGYGKRYFVYKNGFLDKTDSISVIASTQSGTSAAEASKTINLYTPKVLLYEDHPSQGLLLGRALTETFMLDDSEATFVAVPYFATPRIYNNALAENLLYTWKINGSETTPTEKNRITLRKPEGVEGTAKIEVSVKNALSSFQKEASTETRISF